MGDKLKEFALIQLVKAFSAFFSEDMLSEFADSLLDKIEEAVEDSESTIDDRIALPLINIIRDAFGIEDLDDT